MKLVKTWFSSKVILFFLPVILIIGGIYLAVNMLMVIFLSSSSTQDCPPNNAPIEVSVNVDSKTTEENAKSIYSFLIKNFNATPEGASGVLGNFQQESGLNPSAIERPNDPLSGHGLAQWTAGRTTNLKNFANEKNKAWDNLGLQLEFLAHELNTSESAGVQALKETSVESATGTWQTLFERAGIPAMGNRLNYANTWFAKLATSNPIDYTTMLGASEAGQQNYNNKCNITSTGTSDSNILESAKKYVGWFTYPNPIAHNLAMIGGDPRNPDRNGQTDCSGFVWLALENAGYNVPPNMGWYTGSMSADARGENQWLKSIPESEAEAGDIVIVNLGGGAGANGHTAIIAEKWHGSNTKIIQMGGDNNVTNESTFNNSFSSLLSGGDICFARAVKK